jgi:carbon starvation protein CstA
LTAAAKRLSGWGIASLVLLLGDFVFGEYLLYVYDRTGRPLIPWVIANQICAALQLAAVVCGLIAMRRGSVWWGLIVAPAIWFAFVCYLNDL